MLIFANDGEIGQVDTSRSRFFSWQEHAATRSEWLRENGDRKAG